MTSGPLDRTARLFLDTSQFESALDRAARQMAAGTAQAELFARQGLQQLADKMAEVIATNRGLANAPFTVFPPSGGPTKKFFEEITRAESAFMDKVDSDRFQLIQMSLDLQRMAMSGSVSEQAIQSLTTRFAALGPELRRSIPQIAEVIRGLETLQIRMKTAALEAGGLASELGGQPMHSVETSRALNVLSSATQGAMFAMSLMSGGILQAGFGLIFLRFTILKVVAVAAALTAGILAVNMALRGFINLLKAANRGARELEDVGQRLTNFFQSVETGRRLVKLSSDIQIAFGSERKEADALVKSLERVGLANMSAAATFVGAANATETSLSEIGSRFFDIMRADADQREDVVKRFAKDFDIEVRNYGSNLEILEALNRRFGESAAMVAQTQSGMIGRLAGMWRRFRDSVGEVVQDFFKPMIELAMSFVTGLMQGWAAARRIATANGQLVKTTEGFRAAIHRLMPVVLGLGFFLGRILLPAILATARFIKSIIDTMMRWWQATKEIRDAIRGVVTFLKEMWDRISGVVGPILEWIAKISLASLALYALIKAGELAIAMIGSLIKMILAVPLMVVRAVWSGISELLDALERIHNKIRQINNETVQPKTGAAPSGQLALPGLGEPPEEAQRTLGARIGEMIARGAATAFGAAIGGLLAGSLVAAAGGAALAAGIGTAAAAIGVLLYAAIFNPRLAGQIGGAIIGAMTAAFQIAVGSTMSAATWFIQQVNKALMGEFPNIGVVLGKIISIDWSRAIRFGLSLLTLDFQVWAVTLKGLFNVDLMSIANSIINWAQGIWPSVGPHLDTWTEGTRGIFDTLTKDSSKFFEDQKLQLLAAFGSWGDYTGMFGILHGKWDGVVTGIRDIWQRVKDAVRDAIREIEDMVRNIDFGSIGGAVAGAIPGVGAIQGLMNRQFGGVVPGVPGHARLIMAHAGEQFLGSPTFAQGRPSSPDSGGMVVNMSIHVSDSVVTTEAGMQKLADQIMDRVSTKMGLAHRMARHRL